MILVRWQPHSLSDKCIFWQLLNWNAKCWPYSVVINKTPVLISRHKHEVFKYMMEWSKDFKFTGDDRYKLCTLQICPIVSLSSFFLYKRSVVYGIIIVMLKPFFFNTSSEDTVNKLLDLLLHEDRNDSSLSHVINILLTLLSARTQQQQIQHQQQQQQG